VPLREEAKEWLLEEAKTHPIIRTLTTAPGMGPIRTARVVAITANPHPFRTRRHYWSYCGFGIVTLIRSGCSARMAAGSARGPANPGLDAEAPSLLKAVFTGAPTTVITQLPDHPLHKDSSPTWNLA
jgi:hypothetical protein